MEESIINPEVPIQEQVEQIVELSPRKIAAEKVKKRVKIGLILLGIGLSLLIVGISIKAISDFYITKNKKTFETAEEETISLIEQENTITEPKLINFRSDRLGLSFDYLSSNKLIEGSEFSQGAYSLQVNSPQITSSDDATNLIFKEGYILKINAFELKYSELENIIATKQKKYAEECPVTVNISNLEDTSIGNATSKRFSVTGCEYNYIFDYVVQKNLLIEIIKIYKGDVGVESLYLASINKIAETLKFDEFTNKKPGTEEFTTFSNKLLGISFSYGSDLIANCCEIPLPPSASKTLLIIGNEGKTKALGMFIYDNSGKKSLDEIVEIDKNILTEEFTIIKGYKPEGQTTDINFFNLSGKKLSGYSWKNNDLYYLKGTNGYTILVVSASNFSEAELIELFY